MRRRQSLPIFVILATLAPTTISLAQSAKESKTQRQTNAAPQGLPEKPRLAEIIEFEGEVSANGVWRPDNPTKKNDLLEEVAELSCFPQGGKDLVGTEAFCLQATASAPNGMLTVATEWLTVIEWSSTQIIATDDSSICVTSQTIFDLKRKTVIALDIRKPEAQGLRNACDLMPDRQTYYLQDIVDYYGRKAAAESPRAK